MKIDFAIITSDATSDRIPLTHHWTRHCRTKPRFIGDSDVGASGYESAIDKTLHAISSAKDAEWLYIVDDDGYVIPSRLEEELSFRDHKVPGCVGFSCGVPLPHDGRDLPGIHGGPGFALSRPIVREFQEMIKAGDIVRHHRNSDATVAIQLDRIGVLPSHDARWHAAIPYPEQLHNFIACHRIINNPHHISRLPELDEQQAR